MPVLIDNAVFTYGAAPTTYYQSNAGDRITATLRLRSQIRVSSLNNTLTQDPSTNSITSPGVSWLDEGFRPGDWVLYYIRNYPSGSVVAGPFWTQVQAVTDQIMDVTSLVQWYDFTSEYIEFYVVDGNGSTQQVQRDEVDVLLNHCINSQPGTPNSLIDGEVTRVRFSNLGGTPIATPIPGTILGNQSGQFLESATFTRVVIPDANFFGYDLEMVFVNSGLYDPDGTTWFFSAEALKAFIGTQWARVPGEPYARLVSNYDLPGDTGYYDEPYNTGVADSTLVQGTTGIDYCTPTTHTVVVDGPLTDIMIGAAYKPTDFAYYKNKVNSQTELTMVIPSTPIAIGPLGSYLNPSGAGYTIDITDITVTGSQTAITFIFTPNAVLETFMDTRDPEDRLFLVWVKCGSINHLVYEAALECTPPPADPLVMVKSAAFLDHAKNVDTYPTNFIDRECNTEDDLGYYGEFLLTKGNLYEKFRVYMEAENLVTGENFSLRVLEYNFLGVPYSGDGRYLLNETLTVNAALPTTSFKRDSILKLEPSLDTPTEYGVSIYAPFLMDWRYWIPYPPASTDFWPTQNKNWVQYETAPWNVQLRLELVDDLGGHNHIEDVKIFDYDSNPIVNQTIELYEDSSNLNVPIILEGQLHRVVTLHTLTGGLVWDPSNIWGQITVEPFEGQPRWICSTAVDYDNNTNNPLTPLSGTLINITYPAANIARLECYFNPDLLNLSNGVKFTTKIKGCTGDPEIGKTTAPDDIQKTTTDGSNKTLAI